MKKILKILLLFLGCIYTHAQSSINTLNNSQKLPLKIQHAEPLYIDLMRDLGARKREAEFNLGFGVANHNDYYEYNGFIEYEWAIADRIGLEVEVPFSFNKGIGTVNTLPNNKIEGLKLATQYTFLVNEKYQTSLAVGYLHEFEFNSFKDLKAKSHVFEGMKMNPIFVAAKKFNNFHTLLYMGPVFQNHFEHNNTHAYGTLNTSFHYVLPNSKHFIGIENNMEIHENYFEYIMRPQMKLVLSHDLAVGFLTGIPIKNNHSLEMDFMTRIIWEPNFK